MCRHTFFYFRNQEKFTFDSKLVLGSSGKVSDHSKGSYKPIIDIKLYLHVIYIFYLLFIQYSKNNIINRNIVFHTKYIVRTINRFSTPKDFFLQKNDTDTLKLVTSS